MSLFERRRKKSPRPLAKPKELLSPVEANDSPSSRSCPSTPKHQSRIADRRRSEFVNGTRRASQRLPGFCNDGQNNFQHYCFDEAELATANASHRNGHRHGSMPVAERFVPLLTDSPFNRTRSEYGTAKYRRTKTCTLSVSPHTPQRTQSARYKSTSPCHYHRPLGTALSNEFAEDNRMRFGNSPGSNRRQLVDQWPTPQQSRVLNRFLQLPESEDYERQRNFVIDAKGCLVNRGDSFRRRSHTGQSSTGSHGTGSTEPSDSRTNSGGSSRAHSPYAGCTPPEIPSPPPTKFTVLVSGTDGTGKSALIGQFKSSESVNLFNVSTDEATQETKVPVSLEGTESEIVFVEKDYAQENDWQSQACDGYLVVYAADSRSSFRSAADILALLKQRPDSLKRPTILVANKVDLARKRVVSPEDGRALAKHYDCKFAEVSAALSHNTDGILVGILAQMRQFYARPSPTDSATSPTLLHRGSLKQRIARRKSSAVAWLQSAADDEDQSVGCSNISAAVQRILKRRGSRSCDNLFA